MMRRKVAPGIATLFTLTAIFVGSGRLFADESKHIDENPPTEFAVEAVAPPDAALSIRFLPAASELKSEDAAPLYMKAIDLFNPDRETSGKINDLIYARLPEFDAEKAKKLFPPPEVFDLLERAALCDPCHWKPAPDGKSKPYIRLTRLRYALELRGRIALKAGRPIEACRSVRCGIALAGHLAQGGTLVDCLVANGWYSMWLGEAATIEQQPGSPNLYWAFARLHHPLIDLPRCGDASLRDNLIRLAPELRERSARDLTSQELEAFLRRTELLFHQFGNFPFNSLPDTPLEFWAMIAKSLPAARVWLLNRGMDRERLNQMKPFEAVAIYFLEDYQNCFEELSKWFHLPYWQAAEGSRRTAEKLAASAGSPLTKITCRTFPHMVEQFATVERTLAAQQTVEALRAYAATHGRFPATLSELVDTPAPLDPMTGKDFIYELKDGVALIRSDVGIKVWQRLKYRVTLVEKKK